MNEVLINARTSPLPPAIAGNGASDFVVVWNDIGGVNLKGQIFGADGTTGGSAFPINTTTEGTHFLPAAAMLSGFSPGFVVAWIAQGPAGHNVLVQRFDPNGKKRGGEIQANSADVNTEHPPVIVRLTDLNFVVSWATAHLDEGIRARIFKPDGRTVGQEFGVNTSTGVHFAPIGTELDDGGFAIAWQGGPSLFRTFPRLQMFQPDGSKSGSETGPNLSGFKDEMAMTFLAAPPDSEPGHFAIAYIEGIGGEDKRLIASLFGPDGVLKNSTNITHRDDQTIASQVAMRALPNQRLVVTWTEKFVAHVGDRDEDNVMAKILFEDRAAGVLLPSTKNIQVNAPPGNQNRPCVATLLTDGGGEVTAIAWIDDNVSGAESSSRAVKARGFLGLLT
jgi:large repetitive protein